ncbi:MAG: DEAD/DEAH box helicase [Wenzhouxiangellaceae bacterium]|nr:DEAD/DEAH box helicase [Wenzhouxiangellaceae bacterium]
MPKTDDTEIQFTDLGLPESLLSKLSELGYEAPSPIQAATIPALLAGADVLGQAQTGTGKTAAFALPVLTRLDRAGSKPAALVLAPTRELAIQVAEAFHRYAGNIKGFHVLPIYGGQAYGPQLAGLRRGADVIVGTPGRVIDHLNKGTLKLDSLQTLVLDEADEMLRMGFIDDVKNVLERIPASCQKALFSATMPDAIRRIADKHLKNPQHITIRSKTTTAANIRQRYWMVGGVHKLDALTRILEVEPFDAMLVFARTRVATEELAGRLEARGFSAAALNGDVAQKNREKIVEQLKRNKIDILVATDVAARGLDVERISHVVNYDIPHDTEAYVHRIGRTGRAGRSGDAILFVAPRERNMLRAIERATRQPIEAMTLPTIHDVNEQRVARFQERISEALDSNELESYRAIVQSSLAATGASIDDLAAALALLARGEEPLQLEETRPAPRKNARSEDRGRPERGTRPDRGSRPPAGKFVPPSGPKAPDKDRSYQDKRETGTDFVTYRVAVGHDHGAKPGNIVGAIANEAGLNARQIGRIDIHESSSQVDLPANLSAGALEHLKTVWVAGQQLKIELDDGSVAVERKPRPASRDTAPKKPFADRGGDRKSDKKAGLKKVGQGKNRPPRTRSERKAALASRGESKAKDKSEG